MEIKPRLKVEVVKYKQHSQQCDYCFERFPSGYEFRLIDTSNVEILSFFNKSSTKHSHKTIRLCQKCFSKLYEMLNEVENEGWQTLEESE